MRHEFAAARQFALQAAVARGLGDPILAAHCDEGARDELRHAGRLADAILAAGALPAEGAPEVLPTGRTRDELIDEACRTESTAVVLYRDALHAAAGWPGLRSLFASLHREEAEHLAQLQRMRRAAS
jgi:bacterioferritin (cytochrome b1)